MNLRTRSEQLIIKEVLSNPGGVHDIMDRVDFNMFIDPTTKLIFEAITDLYLNHEPINITTINDSIKKSKSIYNKEAIVEMSKIISMSCAVNEYESCIDSLVAEAIRSEHVELAGKLSLMSNRDDYDPNVVINLLQDHLVNNKYKSLLNKKSYDNETLLNELEEKMKIAADSNGVSGIRTGFNQFDEITSGMQPTNLIIIAARPGLGKSALGLSIMKTASIRGNKKGLFISCEMDEVQVMKRLISVDSGVQGYSIKKGRLMPNERGRFERSKRRIADSGVRIVGGSFTITDIVTMVHKMKYAEGLDYVIVDYIQKIQSPGAQNRTNEVGDVSRRLKDMANELKIPIVALAQLSRAVEMRGGDKRPQLSDLRESGDIEQDADIVAFLYRHSYYFKNDESAPSTQAYIYIAKHRDGELADVELQFIPEIPVWQNIGDTGDYDDNTVQTSIERFDNNNDFDF